MTKHKRQVLDELDKQQLIYLIEQFYQSQSYIGEICVDESKQHISSEYAVSIIRASLYQMPSLNNVEETKAYIDMKLNKISASEYRKKIGLD